MRGLLALACASCLATSASAQDVGVGVGASKARSTAIAISQGGSVPTNQTVTETLKNVPNLFAPGLASAGLETCLGSVSGGGSAVGWGANFGTTVPDPGCNARLDARTLWSFGLKAAAVARLCQTPEIYHSMPDVCARYAPPTKGWGGMLDFIGSGGSSAGSTPGPATEYAGGPIEVIEHKTGALRMCNDFDVAGHRCRAWAYGVATATQRR